MGIHNLLLHEAPCPVKLSAYIQLVRRLKYETQFKQIACMSWCLTLGGYSRISNKQHTRSQAIKQADPTNALFIALFTARNIPHTAQLGMCGDKCRHCQSSRWIIDGKNKPQAMRHQNYSPQTEVEPQVSHSVHYGYYAPPLSYIRRCSYYCLC
jgi:hypothetical protein